MEAYARNGKKFIKCDPKERRLKRIQKQLYKESQNSLDKRIRFYERKHKLDLALNIDSVRDSDPKQFWDQIKKLGPQRKSKFPTECYNDAGEVTSNSDTLKHTWERDFSLLYNPAINDAFDADFKAHTLTHKQHLERNMLDPLYLSNVSLNYQITEEEIRKVVTKAKAGKSCGIDELPYEVLKFDRIIKVLHQMFMLFFESGIIPSIWHKAII